MSINLLGRVLGILGTPRASRARRKSFFRPESLPERCLPSITIAINYTYDSGKFFTPARKAAVEQAAKDIGSKLTDHLLEINNKTFDPYFARTNTWTAQFENPATADIVRLP